jgi:hypothetical protein
MILEHRVEQHPDAFNNRRRVVVEVCCAAGRIGVRIETV